MKRNAASFLFNPEDLQNIKEKVLQFASNCNTFSYYDNNQYSIKPNRYELLVGIDILERLNYSQLAQTKDWIFGQLNFELFPQGVGYHPFTYTPSSNQYHIYIPKIVIRIESDTHQLIIESYEEDPHAIYESIQQSLSITPWKVNCDIHFHQNVEKEKYIQTINDIKSDIFEGYYYEINYCIPFDLRLESIDPISLFSHQNRLNPSPMAACVKQGETYILCTSPERFLYKENRTIISQPIKGTSPKAKLAAEEPIIIHNLKNNPKERAENVMIVDLTRNDLAKCCETGSIEVSELFEIYTFPFVYQMISTIQGTLLPKENFTTILQECFPMGSMSGAPKKMVLDYIRKYESNERKIYSGSLFYINPDGDFDSNVVIRSLIYNELSGELNYHVGSAITYDSIPENEWEELQWKAQSMKSSFQKIN